jgi:hypothetical protein
MSDKPYDDPQRLAELYYTLHDNGTAPYSDIADELGCSVGTISLRFNEEHYPNFVETIESMGPEDFEGTERDPYQIDVDKVSERIYDCLHENWVVSDRQGKTIVSEGMGLIIYVCSGDYDEFIDKCYSSGYTNPCVAVSEHECTDVVRDKFDSEAIGLLSVSKKSIEVVSPCDLTIGSGVSSIFGGSAPTTGYREVAWLTYHCEVEDFSMEQLCEMCSLLPRSIRQMVDEYGIDANW